MKTASGEVSVPESPAEGGLTILRPGFWHPKSERYTLAGDRGKHEPPEIKGRACTWDADASR